VRIQHRGVLESEEAALLDRMVSYSKTKKKMKGEVRVHTFVIWESFHAFSMFFRVADVTLSNPSTPYLPLLLLSATALLSLREIFRLTYIHT
jgi:hypothetical protein